MLDLVVVLDLVVDIIQDELQLFHKCKILVDNLYLAKKFRVQLMGMRIQVGKMTGDMIKQQFLRFVLI